MKPATLPRPSAEHRLLRIDPSRGHFSHHRAGDLPELLSLGDLLVVNDAATLPASTARRDTPLMQNPPFVDRVMQICRERAT